MLMVKYKHMIHHKKTAQKSGQSKDLTDLSAYAKISTGMIKQTSTKKISFISLTPLLTGAVVVISSITAPMVGVQAVSIDDQIRQKQQEQAAAQAEANKLSEKADTVEEQIDKLQTEIAGIQAKIDANVARQNELSKKIEEAQKRLEQQKELLSANIRSMYIEGDISPLEMIASSKNISDFVDKQEYRDRIKESITNTLDEIEKLKKQLDAQKAEVTKIIEEQKTLKGERVAKNKEADRKLGSINLSKAGFDKIVKNRQAEISTLLAQQAAIAQARNQWSGGYVSTGGSGGYPWAGAPINGYGYSSVVDSWGLYARQCTSYVAWKLSSQGKGVRHFNGAGNANEWPSTTAGYTSQRTGVPRAGDAAIQYIGSYGHVMYVESVNGDDSITISEYNWIPNSYSSRKIYQSDYRYYRFITFPNR